MCLSLPSLRVAVCRVRSSWCCCWCCCCGGAQACLVAIAIACYCSFSNLFIPHTSITTLLLLFFSLSLVSNPSHKSVCLFIIQGEVLTNSATLHLQYGAPGLTFTMTEPVFLFGSFSESEAKTFQSPPVAVKHDSFGDGNLLPAIQFGDLTEQVVAVAGKPTSSVGKLDLQSEISHKSNGGSPRSPNIQFPFCQNGVAAPSKLLSSQPETTPVLESLKEDGPVIKEMKSVPAPATEVETACELKTSNEVVEPETSKLPQKSWAALVGVHQTSGDGLKNPGQVKNARVGGNNKPPPEGSLKVQPRGLLNTGNSCFANATLQALLSCPPFVDLLQGIRARAVPQTGYPTIVAFANFAGQFQIANEPVTKDQTQGPSGPVDVGRPFAPVMFDDVLRSFSPDQPPRGRPRQEDAQEFLSHLMDRLHEELLWLEGKNVSGQQAVVEDNDEWETVGPKNRSALTRTHLSMKSQLTDIFGGQLCSIVKAKGNKASATVQPFLVLHLDILSDAVQSLEDALRFFAAPESLEGYKAASSKATEVVSASKAIKLQSLPPVLLLHFMRFSYGASGSGKLNKSVRFPLNLTLGRELFVTTSGPGSESRKYELVATMTHHGKDPSVGHYTADCKQRDGRWLRFDDAVVSVVPVNRVLQEHAYVLFYKRV